MPTGPRRGVLVAGVGNIFRSDDGFGIEVARRMAAAPLPDGVRIADYGIRSLHLAYDLVDAPDMSTILVDAMPRGGAPGTLYVLEAATDAAAPCVADGHSVSPDAIVALVRTLGGSARRLVVVGCEPASIDDGMGLSAPVEAAVDAAIRVVRELITAAGRTDASCV